MTKKEVVALVDDFISKTNVKEMFEFTSSPEIFCDDDGSHGRHGWEKWLQFEFAKYLFENDYKEICLEDICRRHKGKNKDKCSNQVDVTFSRKNEKNESLNCLEIKVNKSPGVSAAGMIKDIEGVYQISQTNWKFRTVICLAFFHDKKFAKNYKYKNFIENNNSKLFYLQKKPVNGWRYFLFVWSDSAKNMKQNYDNFNMFYKNDFMKIKSEWL